MIYTLSGGQPFTFHCEPAILEKLHDILKKSLSGQI
jgi:hypothetical protein